MDVPYFKQDKTYTCGPVVLQMVFRYYGKIYSEADLVKRLKPTSDQGTNHQAMIDLARTEGFFTYVNEDSSLDEVTFLISKNIPIIVHFIEPDTEDGHYSIITNILDSKVVLNDPWNGKDFKMEKKDFEKRWVSMDGKHKKWIMAVSDSDIHFGKQYLPK